MLSLWKNPPRWIWGWAFWHGDQERLRVRNDTLALFPEGRLKTRSHSNLLRFALSAAILPCCLAGCSDRKAVRVQLQARHIPGEPSTLLEIQAQVAGPLAGLHYNWFSVSGECIP